MNLTIALALGSCVELDGTVAATVGRVRGETKRMRRGAHKVSTTLSFTEG